MEHNGMELNCTAIQHDKNGNFFVTPNVSYFCFILQCNMFFWWGGFIYTKGLAKRVKARILFSSTSEVYGDPEVCTYVCVGSELQGYSMCIDLIYTRQQNWVLNCTVIGTRILHAPQYLDLRQIKQNVSVHDVCPCQSFQLC